MLSNQNSVSGSYIQNLGYMINQVSKEYDVMRLKVERDSTSIDISQVVSDLNMVLRELSDINQQLPALQCERNFI